MTVALIVFCCLFFITALLLLPQRLLLAPAAAYGGLIILSFAENSEGYPLLPINSTILTVWFFLTVAVMITTLLQPAPLRDSRRGMGFMILGAIAGMVVGLLGFSISYVPTILYGIMIAGTLAGTFFGFLLYTNTPAGRPVSLSSGNFFKYLLAKGFPTAITVMQIGVVLVLVTVLNQI